MTKELKLTANVRLKAAEGGKPRRFAILAYNGGLLPVDGFPHPVVVDLQGLTIPGNIPILIDHTKSVEATLGITDSIVNDGTSLTLGGAVTGQSPTALQVIAQFDAGQAWQASIGAIVAESVEIAAGQAVTVNGQHFVGPLVLARKATLRETSVLPMGADATTQVNLAAKLKAAATLKGAAMPTFEEWVATLGIDPTGLTPEDMAALQLAYESKQAPVPAAPAPAQAAAPAPVVPPVHAPTAAAGVKEMDLQAMLAEGRKLQAAQLRKSAEIQAKAAGHPMIAAKAIEEDWSLDKVELEVLKASSARTRPTSFTSAQNAPENLPLVLEAAVAMTRKHKSIEKDYDDKTLQAAHHQFKRGIGLQQMFLTAAAAAGMPVAPGMRITTGNLREVLTHCFGQPLQAAFSTLSLPGILSNVANKEILQGYMEEDAVWREVAGIKSVSDFKTVTSYRMLDDMEYEKLGPSGEIKHGKLGEESYTRQADTYAKMFSLTRRDIINDDMGAFDDLKSRVGKGSGKKLNSLFWTTWLAATSTHWTSARSNYIEGATSNLGTDGVGLTQGVTAFRKMRSPSEDGSKRGVSGRPSKLLVPPELEAYAEILYVATNKTAVKGSDVNIHANKYQPIIANQLSDSTFTGYSTTAWWLLNPDMGPPIVVSFLNGTETPTVESADADFNTLGVQFRGYHDFGVDMAEYLSSLKSKGAA